MRQSQDLGLDRKHRRYVIADSDGKPCRGRLYLGFERKNENDDDVAGGGGKRCVGR
jgi:hypothetical protein